MTDTKADRLDEIREIWAKATPGPWARVYDDVTEEEVIAPTGFYGYGKGAANVYNDADAIAAAPDHISWLIAEVEKYRKFESDALPVLDAYQHMHTRALRAEAEVERLLEAWIEDTT